MKRSIWTMAITALACAMIAAPLLAASPSVTKSVVGGDDGTSVIVLRVSASSASIYGVSIKASGGSVKDIVAPKGWVGITSGRDILFRTGEKPIGSGSTLSFRLYASSEDTEFTVTFRDKDGMIGNAKSL